jgi:hypothetical protein
LTACSNGIEQPTDYQRQTKEQNTVDRAMKFDQLGLSTTLPDRYLTTRG